MALRCFTVTVNLSFLDDDSFLSFRVIRGAVHTPTRHVQFHDILDVTVLRSRYTSNGKRCQFPVPAPGRHRSCAEKTVFYFPLPGLEAREDSDQRVARVARR